MISSLLVAYPTRFPYIVHNIPIKSAGNPMKPSFQKVSFTIILEKANGRRVSDTAETKWSVVFPKEDGQVRDVNLWFNELL